MSDNEPCTECGSPNHTEVVHGRNLRERFLQTRLERCQAALREESTQRKALMISAVVWAEREEKSVAAAHAACERAEKAEARVKELEAEVKRWRSLAQPHAWPEPGDWIRVPGEHVLKVLEREEIQGRTRFCMSDGSKTMIYGSPAEFWRIWQRVE